MKLLLIRHGQSEANAEGRLQGHLDSPLSERGRAQAQALARRLQGEGWQIAALYASDLRRAAETADILAARLNRPVVHDARLREYDYGLLNGLTWPEIEALGDQIGLNLRLDAEWPDIPGAEGLEAFRARVAAALEDIRARHQDGDIAAIVAHGGSLSVLLSHLLGLPPRRLFPFRLSNASLSIVEFYARGPRLALLNDTCHLPSQLRE